MNARKVAANPDARVHASRKVTRMITLNEAATGTTRFSGIADPDHNTVLVRVPNCDDVYNCQMT